MLYTKKIIVRYINFKLAIQNTFKKNKKTLVQETNLLRLK